ncbi:excinuclease ABC subunit UvrA [Streptomyces phaeoluteigriseus]|uniref:UvrABC system protein A n=1 Tax=Streptomyces phaeoluteigriseus TaxID=114686 RepID=A0ABY4ZC94_9ACTN|nr:excinuclease ABC subunit UvrA [Streptomyces phaeoluteigriseus]USQ86654.1 excinuclease ABC subunit UvrA [Streptomyces phaeoluteigriseus]
MGTGEHAIEVVGARTHNLDDLTVSVPKGRVVAFTGVSGSGKTSLLIDTIHAEAQLRYLEGISPFVRQFITPRDRPQVTRIEGLPPTLAVDQRTPARSPRSTLATVTGVGDYLGLAFARLPPLARDWDPTLGAVLKPVQFNPAMPEGCCAQCRGSGGRARSAEALLIIEPGRPLLDGASPWFAMARAPERATVQALARRFAADLGRPWREQPEEFRRAVLHGTGEQAVEIAYEATMKKSGTTVGVRDSRPWPGAIAEAERLYRGAAGPAVRATYEPFVRNEPCAACEGTGLGVVARTVRLGGRRLHELLDRPVEDVLGWAEGLAATLGPAQGEAAQAVLPALRARLRLLVRLGVGHVQLSRPAPTLSGGELQRARVAAQLSTDLSGVAFVLDEPSAGLHPADKARLGELIEELRGSGNTVLMIEHDPELISRADWVIDVGPGAGRGGGRLVAQGAPREIAAVPESLTGRYLAMPGGRVRRARRPVRADRMLSLTDVDVRTVRADRIDIPLGALTCLTGVSGSGKSTLLMDGVAGAVQARLDGTSAPGVGGVDWTGPLHWATVVDQEPIGRTPRSNPATYTKAFNLIRNLFAGTDAAARRGLTAGSFSFNSPGGRCEPCTGYGVRQVDMNFLPDVWVTCDVCDGRRFGPEVLAVTYQGLAIDEVLDLTIDEASELLDTPALRPVLTALRRTGLGYMRLGQSATVLSGGEAQRLKLAAALTKGARQPGLVVLDEPVTGLHPADVQVLVDAFDVLIAAGNTVVLAEHDLHLAAAADWLVDMGPGSGAAGGSVLHCGPPDVLRPDSGPTAGYLCGLLAGRGAPTASVDAV